MGDPDAVSQKAGIAIGMPDRSIRHERDPDDFDVVTRVVVSGDTYVPPPDAGSTARRGKARAPATPDKGGAGAAAAAAAAAASSSSSSSVDGVLAPRLCTICYDEVRTYSALVCGHAFCNTCYRTYLEVKIADEGHAAFYARCPEPSCSLIVSPALVRSVVPPGDNRRRYDKAASLARSYVDDQPSLKWCPSDCGAAVRARAGLLSVRCSCAHRFCFGCMEDDHFPATCDDLRQWSIKCRDDSETFNWLVANTKACPKCGTSIEKNGGCNHMTCRDAACKYEFCWVCLGPWKEHSGSYYSCNRYDPEKEKESADGKKKDSSRQALERYLHYYTRFTNHNNSLKLELEAKARMEAKVREMEQLGDNTWMDCQYLVEANEALHDCRYALKFTYVFAFYLPRDANFRHHFEMQQTMLEQQTEGLAELLERDAADIERMEVVHCFQMALKRRKQLFEIVDEENRRQAESAGGAAGASADHAAGGSGTAAAATAAGSSVS